jgi:putative SOS response-associated peptidase YedK
VDWTFCGSQSATAFAHRNWKQRRHPRIGNHLFTRNDGQPIALAGLWDRWTSKDKSERKETYTIVTTAPSAFAAQFHDRMPCVLELRDVDQWLKDLPEEAASLMRPAKDVLQERPLGKAINNVKNNARELLAVASCLSQMLPTG